MRPRGFCFSEKGAKREPLGKRGRGRAAGAAEDHISFQHSLETIALQPFFFERAVLLLLLLLLLLLPPRLFFLLVCFPVLLLSRFTGGGGSLFGVFLGSFSSCSFCRFFSVFCALLEL